MEPWRRVRTGSSGVGVQGETRHWALCNPEVQSHRYCVVSPYLVLRTNCCWQVKFGRWPVPMPNGRLGNADDTVLRGSENGQMSSGWTELDWTGPAPLHHTGRPESKGPRPRQRVPPCRSEPKGYLRVSWSVSDPDRWVAAAGPATEQRVFACDRWQANRQSCNGSLLAGWLMMLMNMSQRRGGVW